MGGLSVNINNDDSISSGDQSVEKGDVSVTFGLDGKRENFIILVSFDVVSLFTAIPVDKACVYIRKKLEQDATLPSRTNLDIDDITKLLQFTLSNNYFMFNDRIYKQVHGCAMGSPVSGNDNLRASEPCEPCEFRI